MNPRESEFARRQSLEKLEADRVEDGPASRAGRDAQSEETTETTTEADENANGVSRISPRVYERKLERLGIYYPDDEV